MLTALLLLKPRPSAGASRSPFQVELFEYVGATDDLVLLRLTGRWRPRDLRPRAAVTLEVRTGQLRTTYTPLPDSVEAGAGWRAPGWRASFSIPLTAAEDAATAFRLRADGVDVPLPRPVERAGVRQPPQGAPRPRPADSQVEASGAQPVNATAVEREMRVEARRALAEARAELEDLRAEAERRGEECSTLTIRIAAEEKALALARAENTRGARRFATVRRRIADLDDTLKAVRTERDADRSRADALAQRLDRLEAEARSRRIRVGESTRRISELRDALAERAQAGGTTLTEHEPPAGEVAELQAALDAARAESALERRRAATLAGQLIAGAEAPSSSGRGPTWRGLPRPLSGADRRTREVAKAERRLAEIKSAVERALEHDGAPR